MDRIRKHSKLIIFVLIVVVILVLNHIFGWSKYFSDTENLNFISEMIDKNIVLASVVYCLVTILCCVVLALPGVTFAIIAGVMFGPWLGTLLCLIATTLGAIIAFIAGRYFLKDSVKPMIQKNKLMKKLLFDSAGKSDVVILMITRLVPIFPYNLQNFAYGVTDMTLSTYSLFTFIFLIPGVALYTIGTAGIADASNRGLYLGIAAVLLVAVLATGWYVKKKYITSDPEMEELYEEDEERRVEEL